MKKSFCQVRSSWCKRWWPCGQFCGDRTIDIFGVFLFKFCANPRLSSIILGAAWSKRWLSQNQNGKVAKTICTNLDPDSYLQRTWTFGSCFWFTLQATESTLRGPGTDLSIVQVRDSKSMGFFLQVIVNLLGSSLVGSKEGEATLSTAYQTHQKSSPVRFNFFSSCL